MTIRRWMQVSMMVASTLLAVGCTATSGNASIRSADATSCQRACSAGSALINPASKLRGVAPVRGDEHPVANVDGNAVRFVDAPQGYSTHARAAANSDVGRGNVAEPCAF